MRTLKYFLAYSIKHKERVHQLYFIGSFFQEKTKNRVFLKLDRRYVDYFPENSNFVGIALILLKSMYGMTNSGNLFSNGLTEWLLEADFIQSQCQMFIYYKYAPYGKKIVFKSFVDDCVYWYNYEAVGKWFVDTLGKIFH